MNAVEKKMLAYYHEIGKMTNFSFLFGIEQELIATEIIQIDFDAEKSALYHKAAQRLKHAKKEINKIRARKILDALEHATIAEHLLNIYVYDSMFSELEFRGTPEPHGIGYYDMPGNIEFRINPISCPIALLKTYRKLINEITVIAKQLGLSIKWRSEHLNFSIWCQGKNITSISHSDNPQLVSRILEGLLDANDEIRLLIPNFKKIGSSSTAGPNRLDNYRIVNSDADVSLHRIEQRDVLRYGKGKLNLPYRLLIIMSGVWKGITTNEGNASQTLIKAIHIDIADRQTIANLKLDDTYRALLRLELDAENRIINLENLFDKKDNLFGGRRIGSSVSLELAGDDEEHTEQKVKSFFNQLTFSINQLDLPGGEDYRAFNKRISELGIRSVKTYDSIRLENITVENNHVAKQKVKTLYDRLGKSAVNHIRYKNSCKVQVG